MKTPSSYKLLQINDTNGIANGVVALAYCVIDQGITARTEIHPMGTEPLIAAQVLRTPCDEPAELMKIAPMEASLLHAASLAKSELRSSFTEKYRKQYSHGMAYAKFPTLVEITDEQFLTETLCTLQNIDIQFMMENSRCASFLTFLASARHHLRLHQSITATR